MVPWEVGMNNWAPWIPCTNWPEVRMNWGIATGWGWDNNCGNVAIGAELGGKRCDVAVVLDGVDAVAAAKFLYIYWQY